MKFTEKTIEVFIKDNREKFDVYDPSTYHDDHFFLKLRAKFKKFISIVPYLIKVMMAWTIVTIISIVYRGIMIKYINP